ncbi:hypothetical protein PAXRUDRAFT_770069 [Paxillus rubicundulus Ve08.2h10]|uniref:Uncharacterized protein n=1 Tax=Paxillus rubicundulus Ve08.2h10 TaxID=930991 RepID=A0A0D0EAL6_9AGAM|nr:hypothetical protein PAXRUDRAFT_770069 [Paxillus rubicundulus Ve08.2h10]
MAPISHLVHADPGAWAFIHQFSSSNSMTLPQAEDLLKEHLGTQYSAQDWGHALKVVMDAEGDTESTSEAVEVLTSAACPHMGLIIKVLVLTIKAPQLDLLEQSLLQSMDELKAHKCIIGAVPTINKILDPFPEKEIGESVHFEDNAAIVAEVQCCQAIRNGEIIEVELLRYIE